MPLLNPAKNIMCPMKTMKEFRINAVCAGPTTNRETFGSGTSYSPHVFNASDDCPICMSSLRNDISVRLHKCNHGFHRECLDRALQLANKCPICRVMVGDAFGKSPYGSLVVYLDRNLQCSGYSNSGTFILQYEIPSGRQSFCHDLPNHKFSGAYRTAYLPDVAEGRALLKRLLYAFVHGLTFTVGTSLTSGRNNTVTWTSIHHKTSVSGGPHGYPDSGYFLNCNEELDGAGVPQADELPRIVGL